MALMKSRMIKKSATGSSVKTDGGFTIIELMIATVIFALVMLVFLSGIVQVTRAYYKGITHSKTQEAARVLMSEVTDAIKLSGSSIIVSNPSNLGPEIPATSAGTNSGLGSFCAGNRKYTYALDRKTDSGVSADHANKLIRNAFVSKNQICSSTMPPVLTDLTNAINTTNGDRSLLGDNMRLTGLRISQVVPASDVPMKEAAQLWQVEISVAYGDTDLLDYTFESGRVTCKPNTGAEFCSIVELSTIVTRRVGI